MTAKEAKRCISVCQNLTDQYLRAQDMMLDGITTILNWYKNRIEDDTCDVFTMREEFYQFRITGVKIINDILYITGKNYAGEDKGWHEARPNNYYSILMFIEHVLKNKTNE